MHFFFFFSSRRRHTRSLCDWSSDVCSSDLEEALCNTDCSARIPKVREQDGEFIPAETGGAIPRSETVAYAPAHLDQKPVAQVVSQAIVYDLEVVQIYEKYGYDLAGLLGANQLLLQTIEKEG